jgi:CysZ protein
MFRAAARAFRQLFTRPFIWVLVKSLTLTILLLAGVIAGIEFLIEYSNVMPEWAEVAVQVVSGLGLVIGSVFLVAPITSLIAGLFVDDIASEVERVYYPNDPPPRNVPLLQDLGVSIRFGIAVVLVTIVALLLLFLPVINLAAFFLANSYLLGREFFQFAALRHLGSKDVHRLRKANRGRIFISGMLIAALVSVPVLNLITPLFATAFMVHNFKDILRSSS